MSARADPILAFVAEETAQSVPAPVHALAQAARTRFGPAICAVLFYGSCLRDGVLEDRLADFYL